MKTVYIKIRRMIWHYNNAYMPELNFIGKARYCWWASETPTWKEEYYTQEKKWDKRWN